MVLLLHLFTKFTFNPLVIFCLILVSWLWLSLFLVFPIKPSSNNVASTCRLLDWYNNPMVKCCWFGMFFLVILRHYNFILFLQCKTTRKWFENKKKRYNKKNQQPSIKNQRCTKPWPKTQNQQLTLSKISKNKQIKNHWTHESKP